MRRAGVRVAELVIGIAERAHHVFLEARRLLPRGRDRAHRQAPGIVLQWFRSSARERGAGSGGSSAREHDAAPEQRAAVEQTIAGNIRHRRSGSSLLNSHFLLPRGYGDRSNAFDRSGLHSEAKVRHSWARRNSLAVARMAALPPAVALEQPAELLARLARDLGARRVGGGELLPPVPGLAGIDQRDRMGDVA